MCEDERNTSTESSYSPQQRKAFYRKFLGKTKVLQENVNNWTIDTLRNIMVNTDNINENEEVEKVNHPDEILLDSEMMCVSSDVLKRCTENLNNDMSPYDHSEFANKILFHLQLNSETDSDEPYWPSLADEVLQCLNVTPPYSYLLGTLKPLDKKPVVKRKHTPRDAQVATKRPENVQAVENVEDGVEETVQKIRALVSHYYKHNNKPLDFFKLILNPVDFGRTVENTLHVSFLVRDGYLTTVRDDKGKLIIYPSSKEALSQAKRRGNDSQVQNVMSLSVQQWQILKQVYQLNKPMINFGTSSRT